MKCKRLFFLLFLVPNLIYAFNQRDCANLLDKVGHDWERHNKLVEQFKNLPPEKIENGLSLLQNAIARCRRAIGHCDKVLDKIASKSKRERTLDWCVRARNTCDQHKEMLKAAIDHLQGVIKQIHTNKAIALGQIFFQEGQRKASVANATVQACPSGNAENASEVIAILNAAAQLFDEAAADVHQALNQMSPYIDDANKAILSQTVEFYQESAVRHRQEAAALEGSF